MTFCQFLANFLLGKKLFPLLPQWVRPSHTDIIFHFEVSRRKSPVVQIFIEHEYIWLSVETDQLS